MPQVDRVVNEFKDQNVQLIAINLEEPASHITSTLERHKLQMTVALDRDGVVAARYEAAAIPQTVLIDRDGKVARLFVGGGPHLADHVRDAVRALLAPVSSKAD
jgi:peroxiredoxin